MQLSYRNRKSPILNLKHIILESIFPYGSASGHPFFREVMVVLAKEETLARSVRLILGAALVRTSDLLAQSGKVCKLKRATYRVWTMKSSTMQHRLFKITPGFI
ncbi:hypothetical protein AVEN_82800-1 [Araneus ventricosus]|uniref:Uncharacterized protein n=1 Tax=Araneus ventricosus TaxID=182803 RepID=A0A4Y2DA26_ARAVE|nr:hypothetical protein AVEN_82800-1 [Araneus ventricosus]